MSGRVFSLRQAVHRSACVNIVLTFFVALPVILLTPELWQGNLTVLVLMLVFNVARAYFTRSGEANFLVSGQKEEVMDALKSLPSLGVGRARILSRTGWMSDRSDVFPDLSSWRRVPWRSGRF